jgi:4-hydroxybenzoate polyprenyltransferase
MIAPSIARARTFSSLVKLSHTVFALPFAAAAVALATLRHGDGAHRRDGL